MEMDKSVRIFLLVGNNRDEVICCAETVRREGYLAIEAFDIEDGLHCFTSTDVDAAILCQSIHSSEQADLARRLKTKRPLTPVVAWTGCMRPRQPTSARTTFRILRHCLGVLARWCVFNKRTANLCEATNAQN